MSTKPSRFLRRFDRIWTQALRVQLLQALCWGLLIALAALGLIAATDYWLEMPRVFRLGGLGLAAVVSLGMVVFLVVKSMRRWRRNSTAAAIEEVFPQLGQRIRTTVQFGEMSNDEIRHQGVKSTLVTALEEDTVKAAQPLPLDAVIPWKSLALASLSAAILGICLTAASALDWQWRTAAQRTLLGGDEQYTRIKVEPGSTAVREGETVLVRVSVEGRIGDQLLFWSRRLDEERSPWREEAIPLSDAERLDERRLQFEIPLDRLRHPVEYRVAAASAESEVYRVDLLYPLKIMQIKTTLQTPEYTGIGEQLIEGSSITALEGSTAKLEVELDRPPTTASLVLEGVATKRGEEVPREEIPFTIEGNKLVANLVIDKDQTFSVIAKASDDMQLPANKGRIRARKDEPPQVWFESPSESLEVHTLAEILMRIRVNDDFGISRSGVVFEVNNEEEYPLIDEDFRAVAEAAEEVERTGKMSPKTRATLEKVLPLEHFELTQQDSIMYYAFAEDIRPESAQRTETDLRFIDIRPFRRQYRTLPSAEGEQMSQGPQLKTLEELVARQRYALNRTIQTAKRFERSGVSDLPAIDNLIKFEGELAKSTRELAEGLIAMGVDETELLFQAETSMLAATDSLSAASYDTATLQMRDALKSLIEGRNRLQIFIMKNRDRQLLALMRSFDRMQQQKLRRPKTDNEEARELAQRLQDLADREQMLASAIGGMQAEGSGGEPRSQDDMEQKPESAPSSASTTDDSSDEQPTAKAKATPQELEDKQLDIAAEARELEKALVRLPKATDLAKQRIASAAKTAEEAGSALGRGAMEEAEKGIGEAGKEFAELSEQVQALLAEEPADRIAAAQQMAAQLAQLQQDFKDELSNPGEGGGLGKARPKQEERPPGVGEDATEEQAKQALAGLGASAEQIAEKAKTLSDVLAMAGQGDDPDDNETAEKLAELMKSLNLPSVVERLQQLPDQVGQGNLEEAKANAGDGAERMEAAAEQLATLHRLVVSPQLEQLAKVEQQLTVLTEELDELDSQPEVTAWHRDANELLDQLENSGIDDKSRQEFQEEMKKAGWGDLARNQNQGWTRSDGIYRAPAAYRAYLAALHNSLQTRMQEIMLGDMRASGDEPIPPQYQELVDRYYEVLARRSAASEKLSSPSKKVEP